MSSSSSSEKPLVPLPRLVLRVAFAGNTSLHEDGRKAITEKLTEIWQVTRDTLDGIAPGYAAGKEPKQGDAPKPGISAYFSTEPALLRLVTGIEEGGDTLAWETLKVTVPTPCKLEKKNNAEGDAAPPAEEKQGEPPPAPPRVVSELAAVLPCPLAMYRATRKEGHLESLDQQAACSAYIFELDGIIEKPTPDTEVAKLRRGRAYRAQSTTLLRHADVLVVVADPTKGKAGGTMETVHKALRFDLPVIFVHAGQVLEQDPDKPGEKKKEVLVHAGEVRILDPDQELEFDSEPKDKWQEVLANRVTAIVADAKIPSGPLSAAHGKQQAESEGAFLLREFFYGEKVPPVCKKTGKRKMKALQCTWDWFAACFKAPGGPVAKPAPTPYDKWRSRSTGLNYHYSSLYRGTFLVNNMRAVLAVACATTTLVLLWMFKPHHPADESSGKAVQSIHETASGHGGADAQAAVPEKEDRSHAQEPVAAQQANAAAPHTPAEAQGANPAAPHPPAGTAAVPTDPPSTASQNPGAAATGHQGEAHPGHEEVSAGMTAAQMWCLMVLALFKLYLVSRIYFSTHAANHGSWNEKTVDYRYLAERLRSMGHLPDAGSFQPPVAQAPQYASRTMRQSAVDWLFDCIVRTVSPAQSTLARDHVVMLADGTSGRTRLITMEPAKALESFSTWVKSQEEYHFKARDQMRAMHRWAEGLGKKLGIAVIGIVAIDIAFLVVELLCRVHLPHSVHQVAPWMVLITALLPAAVAALNGIRFQSECRRLADRSEFMHALLVQRSIQIDSLRERINAARKNSTTDLGSWGVEVLREMEVVAGDFVREAAEWMSLYGKEVHEP